jgi:hypothetical protein
MNGNGFSTDKTSGLPGYGSRGVGSPSDRTGATRVVLAGNHLLSLLTSQNITPLERVFRRNPIDGVLTATPARPFKFEMGAIDVPNQMVFVLLDWRFAIYVPGAQPGNTIELEERQLSTSVGFDVQFTDKRTANLEYQLEPSPPSLATDTFAQNPNAGLIPTSGVGPTITRPNGSVFINTDPQQNTNIRPDGGTFTAAAPQSLFDQLRASSFAGAAGTALSTLPARHRRDMQFAMPFTYVINENQRVNFSTVVFRPIPIAVSFFEVEASGFFIGQNALKDFLDAIVPQAPRSGSV